MANTGLIEVPFGTTLREVVLNIGGGITDRRGKVKPNGFKAVQIGGPSGGCLTQEHLDLPLDYDSLRGVGAMVGSGGLVAMNEKTCMVSIARFFMDFTQRESCGKCVLCREGTRQMLAHAGRHHRGPRHRRDAGAAGEAGAWPCKRARSAAWARRRRTRCSRRCAISATKYDAHVFHKHCPTGQCKALAKPEHRRRPSAKAAPRARKKCPVGAITGEKKQAHVIDQAKCIMCGVCADTCKFEAVVGV